jgi:hypothetical protein
LLAKAAGKGSGWGNTKRWGGAKRAVFAHGRQRAIIVDRSVVVFVEEVGETPSASSGQVPATAGEVVGATIGVARCY